MSGYLGVTSTMCDGALVFAQLSQLTSLESLSLNSVELKGDELSSLRALTRLRTLRLDMALHKPQSLAALTALVNLDLLVLGFGRSTGVIGLCTALTQLDHIALVGQVFTLVRTSGLSTLITAAKCGFTSRTTPTIPS